MNDFEKWKFLEVAPMRDARNSHIMALARSLYAAASENAMRFFQLAHTVARDWIRQLADTDRLGKEDIAGLTRQPSTDDAIDALRRGYDDCDAKARLFVALCLAAGYDARMVPFWHREGEPLRPWGVPGATLSHVAAEVYYEGKYVPVETTLARARVGEPYQNVPKESNGKWRQS